MKINELMVKLLFECRQLSGSYREYVFDYDNSFVPTEKYDSKRSCKKADGYFPEIAIEMETAM